MATGESNSQSENAGENQSALPTNSATEMTAAPSGVPPTLPERGGGQPEQEAETAITDASDSASRKRSGDRHSGGNHKAMSLFS